MFDQFTKPLEPNEIEWKVQSNKNGKTIIVPYIDNRAVMKRLDDCFGNRGWKNEMRLIEGKFGVEEKWGKQKTVSYERGIIMSLCIKIDDEWVCKEDVSDTTDIEPLKGGASGAMKRCATQWGMGRELYEYPRVMLNGEHKFIPKPILERLQEMTRKFNNGELDREVYVLDTDSPVRSQNVTGSVQQVPEGSVCNLCGANAVRSIKKGTLYCPNFLKHKEKKERSEIVTKTNKDFVDSLPEEMPVIEYN